MPDEKQRLAGIDELKVDFHVSTTTAAVLGKGAVWTAIASLANNGFHPSGAF